MYIKLLFRGRQELGKYLAQSGQVPAKCLSHKNNWLAWLTPCIPNYLYNNVLIAWFLALSLQGQGLVKLLVPAGIIPVPGMQDHQFGAPCYWLCSFRFNFYFYYIGLLEHCIYTVLMLFNKVPWRFSYSFQSTRSLHSVLSTHSIVYVCAFAVSFLNEAAIYRYGHLYSWYLLRFQEAWGSFVSSSFFQLNHEKKKEIEQWQEWPHW